MSAGGKNPILAGLLYSVAAYVLWGILPVYFVWLRPAGPFEVVAWRVILSVAFCAILLTVVRGWPRLFALVRDRRVMLWLALAAVLIAVNWTVFVAAAAHDQVVEASLGYFINPIITILLGVLFLGDRLRPLQWAAVAISAIAVAVLIVGLGSFPWIALSLAFSFGFYGLAKNRIGGRVDSVSGLAIETAYLVPASALALVLIALGTPILDPTGVGLVMGTAGPLHTTLLALAGVITAVPLLLFASGARRVPLSYVGLTQYLAPILQFLTGVVLLREEMPPERWIGFGIVWLAVLLLIVDSGISIARSRRSIRQG